jgi:hypothetical protein
MSAHPSAAPRRNRATAALLTTALALTIAGCTSQPHTPHSHTPKALTTPTPTAGTDTADAYWFTVTKRFVGGAQWTVDVRPPADPTDALGLGGVGQVEFHGPNSADIVFEMPDHDADAAGYTGTEALAHAATSEVAQRQFSVKHGPVSVTLGSGVPALYMAGLDNTGKNSILVVGMNPETNTFADVMLTSGSATDFMTDEKVMQALVTSFAYER